VRRHEELAALRKHKTLRQVPDPTPGRLEIQLDQFGFGRHRETRFGHTAPAVRCTSSREEQWAARSTSRMPESLSSADRSKTGSLGSQMIHRLVLQVPSGITLGRELKLDRRASRAVRCGEADISRRWESQRVCRSRFRGAAGRSEHHRGRRRPPFRDELTRVVGWRTSKFEHLHARRGLNTSAALSPSGHYIAWTSYGRLYRTTRHGHRYKVLYRNPISHATANPDHLTWRP